MLKKWLYVSAVLACVGLQSLQARNIFLTPGDPANTGVGEFTSDPLSYVTTIAGPAGPKQVIAGPAGKYYVLGSVSTEGVALLEGTFPNLQTTKRLATAGTPVAFAITGDARRLVVIGSGVQVIDTANDTVLSEFNGFECRHESDRSCSELGQQTGLRVEQGQPATLCYQPRDCDRRRGCGNRRTVDIGFRWSERPCLCQRSECCIRNRSPDRAAARFDLAERAARTDLLYS